VRSGTILLLQVEDELPKHPALPVRSHGRSRCTLPTNSQYRDAFALSGQYRSKARTPPTRGREDIEDDGELGIEVAKGGGEVGSVEQRGP